MWTITKINVKKFFFLVVSRNYKYNLNFGHILRPLSLEGKKRQFGASVTQGLNLRRPDQLDHLYIPILSEI